MPIEIQNTTAEHVVATVDAALLRPAGAQSQYVSDFCQISVVMADRALVMAEQLQFVSTTVNGYIPTGNLGRYLVCAADRQRAGVFRIAIEQYEPFQQFKSRVSLGENAAVAAERIRAIHALGAHRDEIRDTLVSFGSFAQAIQPLGAGMYSLVESTVPASYVLVLEAVCADLAQSRLHVSNALGEQATAFLLAAAALEDLATAYTRLADVADTRGPVVYAGNAVESFLVKFATDHAVGIINAHGINAKVDRIVAAHHMRSKHQNMFKYLGHIRNGADHGVDPEIGHQWQISRATAVQYVHVAIAAIKSLEQTARIIFEL